MGEFKGFGYCYYCGEKMTDEDTENYEAKVQPGCCAGYQCTCGGAPGEPPWCIKCEFKNNGCKSCVHNDEDESYSPSCCDACENGDMFKINKGE